MTFDITIAAQLSSLEERSRDRPDRMLRLRGRLPACGDGAGEAFELLIFRGFSSLTTHPTGFDPDQAALPEGALIASVELLAAPLDPAQPMLLAGPTAVERLLSSDPWP